MKSTPSFVSAWPQIGTEDQFSMERDSQRVIQQQKVRDQADRQKIAGNYFQSCEAGLPTSVSVALQGLRSFAK